MLKLQALKRNIHCSEREKKRSNAKIENKTIVIVSFTSMMNVSPSYTQLQSMVFTSFSLYASIKLKIKQTAKSGDDLKGKLEKESIVVFCCEIDLNRLARNLERIFTNVTGLVIH